MDSLRARVRQFMTQQPRTYGALLLAVGLAIAYWLMLLPLREAAERAAQVHISLKGTFLAMVFLVIGLTHLVFGGRGAAFFFPPPGASRAPIYVLVALTLVLSLAVHFGLKALLAKQGYISHGL